MSFPSTSKLRFDTGY